MTAAQLFTLEDLAAVGFDYATTPEPDGSILVTDDGLSWVYAVNVEGEIVPISGDED